MGGVVGIKNCRNTERKNTKYRNNHVEKQELIIAYLRAFGSDSKRK